MRRNGPRTELYLRSDISGVVKALNQAGIGLSGALTTEEGAYYRAGFIAALRAVSLAFDLDVPEVGAPEASLRLLPATLMLTDGRND